MAHFFWICFVLNKTDIFWALFCRTRSWTDGKKSLNLFKNKNWRRKKDKAASFPITFYTLYSSFFRFSISIYKNTMKEKCSLSTQILLLFYTFLVPSSSLGVKQEQFIRYVWWFLRRNLRNWLKIRRNVHGGIFCK